MAMTETVFILDFDRCLGNEALYVVFEGIIAATDGVDTQKLNMDRAEIEASGESFDMLRWLKSEVAGTGLAETISADYLRKGRELGGDAFLAPGAKELLAYFKMNQIPHMILTYGGDEYQELKLRVSGLNRIHHEIVSSRNKGRHIVGWWNDAQNAFVVPFEDGTIVSARELVLIDDKAVSFEDLPPQAHGYWVRNKSSLYTSQKGELATNVEACDNLFGVLEKLQRA